MKSSLVFVVPLLLAGCAVGPDYARPQVLMQDTWQSGPSTRDATAVPIADAWWTVFADLELDRLMQLAVDHGQDLRQARARLDYALARHGVVRSGALPQVQLQSSAQRQERSLHTADVRDLPVQPERISNDIRTSLTVGFDLDLWGRQRRSIEAAGQEAEAEVASLAMTKLAITCDLALHYFTLRRLDAELVAIDQALHVHRERMELHEARHRAGLDHISSYAGARRALAIAEAEHLALLHERDVRRSAIAVLAGLPPAALTLAKHQTESLIPSIPPGLPSSLLSRRPDLVAQERRLHAACARIGVAEAAFLPDISLTGSLGVASVALTDLVTAPSRMWSIGPSVSLPIFSGGRLRAEHAAARARYDEALASYRAGVLDALRDVEDALGATTRLADQETARTQAADQAKLQADIARERSQRGLISHLEALESRLDELAVERQRQHAHHERAIAAVRLIAALGGGWSHTELAVRPHAAQR